MQSRLVGSPLMRRVIIYAAVGLVVFLLGFIPMWLRSVECAIRLSGAEHRLSMARIESTLASAVINARRGDYEPARQAASDFYNLLGAETDRPSPSSFPVSLLWPEASRGNEVALSQAQIDGVQSLFAGRDEVITLLSRGDPAAADRLSDLYVSYREIMQ